MRVLFVCAENICRSPMAEMVAQSWRGIPGPGGFAGHRFSSAGIRCGMPRAPIDPRARDSLQRRGYAIARHRARAVSVADLDRHDLLVAMDGACLAALRSMARPHQTHKLSLLLDWVPGLEGQDVPDPYFGPAQGFDAVLDLCERGVGGLFARALAPGSPPPSNRGGAPVV